MRVVRNGRACFTGLRAEIAVEQDAFVSAARQTGEELTRAAAERGGKAALQCGVGALQGVRCKGDGIVFRLRLGKRLALLRELRFKRFAFADGTAEACGLVKLALQGAALLGKLRERIPERCTGACGTGNGRVGYWCCRTLRAEELIPCARFVRLAAEGVERVILREPRR